MALPQPGEIWFSPLIGYKVKIVGPGKDRRFIVTDGKTRLAVFASHFDDPRNQWRRIYPAS